MKTKHLQAILKSVTHVLPIVAACMITGCTTNHVPKPIRMHIDRGFTGDLMAGAAKVDITPDAASGFFIAGFDHNRKMTGVKHPLYARALAFKRGNFTNAIVAVPLVGYMHPEAMKTIKGIKGINPTNVIIASTHTHHAPDTIGVWGKSQFKDGKNPAYMDQVRKGIRTAVTNALASLEPAEVGFGAVDVAPKYVYQNRRIQTFEHMGQVDPELTALHVRRPGDQSTIATLFSFACHPEVAHEKNTEVSPDFPHFAIQHVEKELKGIGIYVSGAIGAMQAPHLKKKELEDQTDCMRWNAVERIGKTVGTNAVQAVASIGANYDPAPDLGVWRRPIFIKNQNFGLWLLHVFKIYDHTRYKKNYHESEVNLWQIGDYRLAGIPGEATPDLGFRVKASSGGVKTMLVGLANDELGYLLPYHEQPLSYYKSERIFNLSREAGDHVVSILEILGGMSQYSTPP